jgi:hypothetical protein
MTKYEAAFAAQKSMTKVEVRKILPGTWVEFKWVDGPNEIGMVLERPDKDGHCLHVFWPDRKPGSPWKVDRHTDWDQVVKVHGMVAAPQL